MAVVVNTRHLMISTCRFPIAEGAALDVIERLLAQLFHQINISVFLLLPLKSQK
jgi:hypothetical protein